MNDIATSPVAPPVVFISYSHDSEEHRDRVLSLANRLRRNGVDCTIDQYVQSPPEGWPVWMHRQIKRANFVLIVCTETYTLRFEGEEEAGKGLGAKWEGAIITMTLYENEANNSNFIPVLLTDGDRLYIPDVLRPATYYEGYSDKGYENLYRRLTNQPYIQMPVLGALKPMPARERQSDFDQTHRAIPEGDNAQALAMSSPATALEDNPGPLTPIAPVPAPSRFSWSLFTGLWSRLTILKRVAVITLVSLALMSLALGFRYWQNRRQSERDKAETERAAKDKAKRVLYTETVTDSFPLSDTFPYDKPDKRIWDYQEDQWRTVPGVDDEPGDRDLLVKSTSPGILRDKLFANFTLKFKIEYKAGTTAGWILRAQGNHTEGYRGYFFMLDKPSGNRTSFILRVSAHIADKIVPLGTERRVGITQYGKPRDRISVEVRVEGNRFDCTFKLENLTSNPDHPDDRGDLNDSFLVSVVDDIVDEKDRPLFGHVGLFAGDEASSFQVEHIAVEPLKSN